MAPPFTRSELARAVEQSRSWTETVKRLGYAGNNAKTAKKYAASWRISTDHFAPDAARRDAIRPRFTEEQLREAVAESLSFAETLRRLSYCHTGANPRTVKKYVRVWRISTEHFDPDAGRRRAVEINGRSAIPLDQVLVEGSSYHRGHLKQRLFEAGLKDRRCELCGRGETWKGAPCLSSSITSTGSPRITVLRISGWYVRTAPRLSRPTAGGRADCPGSSGAVLAAGDPFSSSIPASAIAHARAGHAGIALERPSAGRWALLASPHAR
jgi:hypothetical protein